MGLFNFLKDTMKENYDLEDIDDFIYEKDNEDVNKKSNLKNKKKIDEFDNLDDLDDLDEFEDSDDFDEFEDLEIPDVLDKNSENDDSGMFLELEKNFKKYENNESNDKTLHSKDLKIRKQVKTKKKKETTKERRNKARIEEAQYDELLNSIKTDSLDNAVKKIDSTEQKISDKIAKEEERENENIRELIQKAEKESAQKILEEKRRKEQQLEEEKRKKLEEEQAEKLPEYLEIQLEKEKNSEQKISDGLDELEVAPEKPIEFKESEIDEFEKKAVPIPNVNRKPKELEKEDIKLYDKKGLLEYVGSQCELMEEATKQIELSMKEYNQVTENFADIQLIESAPLNIQKKIIEMADRVNNLSVDRRIFRSGESRLSNNVYRRMEEYEEQIPTAIKYIEKQETYYETVKRDMRLLEGEKLSMKMESSMLVRRQLRIRKLSLAAVAALIMVFAAFIITLTNNPKQDIAGIFIFISFLGSVLALGSFAFLKKTEREVVLTEIKLNKITRLLNKTKIKYINAANTLDYEYHKYRIKSSFELVKKFETYLDIKNEQKKILHITTRLNEAEEDLVEELRKLGLSDSKRWLGQVKALVNSAEMVEVRHELNNQRQKLRKQIEYNEGRINDAKKNIMYAAADNPECMNEAIAVIEQFENNRRKAV